MSQEKLIQDIGYLMKLSPKKTLYLDIFCTIQRDMNFIRIRKDYAESIGYDFAINTSDIRNVVCEFTTLKLMHREDTNLFKLDEKIFGAIIDYPYSCVLVVQYDHNRNVNMIESRVLV